MSPYNAKDRIASAMSEQHFRNNRYIVDNLVKKIGEVWEYLPSDIPDWAHFTTNIVGDPWLVYPYDKELISLIISTFESNGWETHWSTRENEVGSGFGNQYPKIRFSHPDSRMIVMAEFNDLLTGSTCKRKIIGKKQVEQDIVEFVCNDDDHENNDR